MVSILKLLRHTGYWQLAAKHTRKAQVKGVISYRTDLKIVGEEGTFVNIHNFILIWSTKMTIDTSKRFLSH